MPNRNHVVSAAKARPAAPLGASRDLAVRRISIIGCGGFVGSHLLDRLVGCKGAEIFGWDPHGDRIRGHLQRPNFTFFEEPLRDDSVWRRLEARIANSDIVINLAAICRPFEYNNNPITVIRTNFIDCYRLVELCAKHRTWLMHFSTSEVYGRTISSYVPDDDYANPDLYELREDETPLIMGPLGNQRWTYATAKQLFERYLYAHHMEMELPFTVIRPLNFFGPRMDFIPGREGEGVPRVLASFMAALLDGKPMQLVDGGHARRTIVSIHDAVDALMLMLQKPEAAKNQIFNIGNRDNEVSIAELAELMRQIYAEVADDASYLRHPIVEVTRQQYYGSGYEDCDRRMPSLENARERLGWSPKTGIRDVLRETIEYYYGLYGGA